MSVGNGQMELAADSPESGEAREELDIDYVGDDMTVGFNARYLLDSLAHVFDPTVELALLDSLAPGIIRPLEDPSFLAVVMPIRI